MDSTTNENAVWAYSNTGNLVHAFLQKNPDGRLRAACRSTITREANATLHEVATGERGELSGQLCKSCETRWNAHVARVERSMEPLQPCESFEVYGAAPERRADAAPRTDADRIAGTRIRCSDGRVRTATRLETVNGTEWIHTEDRSAWEADKSERIDTSRIAEFRAVADAAAYRVTSAPDATDPEWRAALDQLGEALNYLADADPLYATAVGQADAERVTFTGTLTDVAPGDVIHVEGIRATVLDTGTAEGDAVRGDGPLWWADVLGVDEEDRAATFRRPFAVGRLADVAAAEPVTIERPLTIC